jgi:hypothetical protein
VETDSPSHTGLVEGIVEGTRNLGESKASRQEGRPGGSEELREGEAPGENEPPSSDGGDRQLREHLGQKQGSEPASDVQKDATAAANKAPQEMRTLKEGRPVAVTSPG